MRTVVAGSGRAVGTDGRARWAASPAHPAPGGAAWPHARGKRILDVAVAAAGLIVLSGPLVAIGALVRLTSPGSAIYAARRVGRYGREFRMHKFRSMVVGADHLGPLVTAAGDPRITRVGRWLRRSKLDELPALWDVLRGEMSLVGPRPENPEAVRLYTPEQWRVLSVRPGLTSLATLKYRHEEDLLAGCPNLNAGYFAIMQDKLQLDLDYLDRGSPLLDLQLLARTLAALVQGLVPHA